MERLRLLLLSSLRVRLRDLYQACGATRAAEGSQDCFAFGTSSFPVAAEYQQKDNRMTAKKVPFL